MSGGGEVIIRNGTWKQWLNYEVVLGGKPSAEYGATGGVRVKGKYLLAVVLIVGLVVGALVG